MQVNFNPSVNIIRDAERSLTYYPTDNTRRIINQLVDDFRFGSHSFNIIGSFGTGKSSLLWALEQNLTLKKPYFHPTLFGNPKIEIVKFVGEYKSIIEIFAEKYEATDSENNKDIFAKIYYEHQEVIKDGLLVIMIDEFGKFLEYASQNNPEKEIYFFQELAEFVNDPKHNILLLTTVHQNFDAYSISLNSSQRQEWSKVKGRFKEITFNEPVEQLLRLASEHLGNIVKKSADDDINAMEVASLLRNSEAYNLNPSYASDIASGLYPLDLLAANALTISLQRYGQNERSLFSFLESSDHTSIKYLGKQKQQFYSLANVYDYLLFNFYSFIQSKYNPDFGAWKSIRNGIEEIENNFQERTEEYVKIIKTIGLLNLTSPQGGTLDQSFIEKYAKLCLGITNPKELIEKLKSRNVIIYREHIKRFILNEGTDLDVEAALIQAANKVSKIDDVATLLKRYYDLPPVLAKAYTYEIGTPRLFEFVITDQLRADKPTGDIDGFIYLVFNEKLKLNDVQKYSYERKNEPLIYVHYDNSKSIKDLLYELQKLRKVREENSNDKIAVRLLDENLVAAQKALNHFILGNLHSGSNHLTWVWRGEEQNVFSKRLFNQLLSGVCQNAYHLTPLVKNELFNKHKISPSISSARKNYWKALISNWNKIDLDFEKEKFPPEKTIYLTLLKENRISTTFSNLSITEDKNNIIPLWTVSEDFINNSKERKTKVSVLISKLSEAPFKLKQGLVDIWVTTFLFLKRDDFALFGENGYIPVITEETLDLLIRYPDKYEIKAFDIEGVRLDLFNSYRSFLQISQKDIFDNQVFIETIRPFLTFYRQLPEYSKTTKKISSEALAIRKAIENSQDPERTFFDDFPSALGYSLQRLTVNPSELPEYIGKLQKAIDEIRHAYEAMVDRFEMFIQDRIVGEKVEFIEYKLILQKRYKNLKKHLLLVNQRVFIQRLDSTIEDRKAWLNSLSQAVIGKPLEVLTYEDELILPEKFRKMILDLDSLTTLSKKDIDHEKESVFGLEINSFIDGVNKTIVRFPKTKQKELSHIEDSIRIQLKSLGNDNQLNIAALANIIKDLLKNDKG